MPVLFTLRGTARLLGTAILALVVAIAVGEGVPNPLGQPIAVNLLFIALATMVVGLIVAWKWEVVGGLLILGGFAFFAIENHGVKFNLVFGPMLVAGLLYLLGGWLRSRWSEGHFGPD